jgi:hypothetical protein
VKTIGDLPDQHPNRVLATINDREFHVVARNVTLLLLALTGQDTAAAENATESWSLAESWIHLWYSAFIPTEVLSEVQTRVKSLIEGVCVRITRGAEDKAEDNLLGKTWKFASGNTLRLVLRKEEWLLLQNFFDLQEGLTLEEARKVRAATTLALERADYRDRWYFKDETPSMRLAKQNFREDGLLLPFGHPRQGFSIPNP